MNVKCASSRFFKQHNNNNNTTITGPPHSAQILPGGKFKTKKRGEIEKGLHLEDIEQKILV